MVGITLTAIGSTRTHCLLRLSHTSSPPRAHPCRSFPETIFSASDRDDEFLISYEEFGMWYNSGGYAVAPWLELLDLSKWPGMAGVVYHRAASLSQDTTDAEGVSDGDGDDGEEPDLGAN